MNVVVFSKLVAKDFQNKNTFGKTTAPRMPQVLGLHVPKGAAGWREGTKASILGMIANSRRSGKGGGGSGR